MRNIDDILVAAHKSMATLLHDAYEAGRARTATDLKSRMASFFEDLAAEAEAHVAAPPAPPAPHPDAPPSEEQHRQE